MKLSDNGENKKSSANAGNPASEGATQPTGQAELEERNRRQADTLRRIGDSLGVQHPWTSEVFSRINRLKMIGEAGRKMVTHLGVACTCGAEQAEPMLHDENCHVYLKYFIIHEAQRVSLIPACERSSVSRVEAESQSLPVGVQGQERESPRGATRFKD